MKSLCALVLAAAAGGAASQNVWGNIGNWMQVMPAGASSGPLGGAWRHAAAGGGCFYIVGGDGNGGNATWQFDTATFTWSRFPDLPSNYKAPSLAYVGGQLVLNGGYGSFGYSDTTMSMSTTTWGKASWVVYSNSKGPSPRNGHRVAVFGGIMYLFGGWDETQYYNDLWGLDVTSLLAGSASSSTPWVPVIPGNTAGMPGARNSFSFDVFGTAIVLFGGFWHNVQAGAYTACTPAAQCVFFNDVWVWRPGNVGSAGLAPITGNGGWTQVQTSGSVPAGRYGHATGVLADQLFVYGGVTASGTVNDMWVLNLHSHTWAQVTQNGGSPGGGNVAGAEIGHAFFVYNGDSSSLWMYIPTGSTSDDTEPTVNISTAGLGAGIALAVLLTVTNLVFIILVWKRGRSSPARGDPLSAGAGYDQL